MEEAFGPRDEQKRAERLYGERLDYVPDWMWEVDSAGVITYSNRVGEEMLGYPTPEILGTSVFDLMFPEDAEKCRAIFTEAKRTKSSVRNVTTEFCRKDGACTVMSVSCVPMLDDRGELVGFRGISRGITDRWRTEQTQQEVEAAYRCLVEESLVGVYIIQHGRFAYVNPRMSEIFGYSQEEFLTELTPLNIVAPQDHQMVAENIRKRLSGEARSIHYSFLGMRKDGRIIDIDALGTVVQYLGETAIVGSLLDITERTLAEKAMRDSEERYRLLFENSPDVVMLVKDNRFTEINPAVINVLGYTPDELIGWTPWEISPRVQPDGSPSAEKARRYIELAEQIGPQVFEWVHKRKDGILVDCEISLIVYQVHGETYTQTIVRDITERKRAEQHRRRLERQLEGQKRQFYRETILSMTDAKLDICEPADLRPYIASAQLTVQVDNTSEVTNARHAVERFCRAHGLTGDRLENFIVGAGEAITNAIKHGGRGHVFAGAAEDSVWVGVSDKGPGISSLILPRALLLRGFSTKPSLGLGYSIMLDVSDRILLSTGERGTTVILVKDLREAEVVISAEQLPDTWASIPS